MTIVSEKVATRIKEEHIAPIPRWRFQSERALVAFLLMMFLVIGALAISLVLELGDKLELESIIGRPQGFRLALSGFPYFWLIVGLNLTRACSPEWSFLRTSFVIA